MSTKIEPPRRSALEFFDRQFARQVEAGEYGLNPFERAVLPHLSGEVLDLGCGLGNLALAAAERGCRVTALDSSATAIADLARRAGEQGVALEAHGADLRHPAAHCLFGRDERGGAFAGWEVLLSRREDFAAPGATLKRFHTLLARRPLKDAAATR